LRPPSGSPRSAAAADQPSLLARIQRTPKICCRERLGGLLKYTAIPHELFDQTERSCEASPYPDSFSSERRELEAERGILEGDGLVTAH
jgi:hypothetical protein